MGSASTVGFLTVFNSTHIHGTHVPVEEPSTASLAEAVGLAAQTFVVIEAVR
jgi:hypothetical protein